MRIRGVLSRHWYWLAIGAGAAIMAACSTAAPSDGRGGLHDEPGDQPAGDAASTDVASSGPSVTGGGGAAPMPHFDPKDGGAGTGASNDAACASEVHAGEAIPVDIFIMMDQSASMKDEVTGGANWDLLTAALEAFGRRSGDRRSRCGHRVFSSAAQ